MMAPGPPPRGASGAGTRPGAGALGAILDEVIAVAVADDDGQLRADRVMVAFGEASLLPLLVVPAILVVSPLSVIPVFSSVCGLSIFVISVQLIAARRHLWLPGPLARRRLPAARVIAALTRIRPIVDWVDRRTGRRLAWLTAPPVDMAFKVACALAGLAMPFLELVPLSSSLLGSAVCLMALGLIVRDGVIASLAALPVAAAVSVLVLVWG